MFKKFNVEDRFSWNLIGNVAEGRNHLGEEMPVMVYRLFQYTIREELSRRFGEKAMIDVFRAAGELAGREFAVNLLDVSLPLNEFLASLQKIMEQNKMGILRIEKFDIDTKEAVLTIGEDLDCSGLPITGERVCNYDEGFLAGILSTYTKKKYIVTEIDCWASGSRVCRFEAKVHRK